MPTLPRENAKKSYSNYLITVTDPTLRDVCDDLGDVKYKWFEIGIQLGIPRNTLKQFEKEADPLSAAVDYWLKGNAVESAVPVSWKSIVIALKSAYVGEPALAEKIDKKYCQQSFKEQGQGQETPISMIIGA